MKVVCLHGNNIGALFIMFLQNDFFCLFIMFLQYGFFLFIQCLMPDFIRLW